MQKFAQRFHIQRLKKSAGQQLRLRQRAKIATARVMLSFARIMATRRASTITILTALRQKLKKPANNPESQPGIYFKLSILYRIWQALIKFSFLTLAASMHIFLQEGCANLGFILKLPFLMFLKL